MRSFPGSASFSLTQYEVENSTAVKRIMLKRSTAETEASVGDPQAQHSRLSKRFAALSRRATLVALAPGTGKSTLTALLNEALRRKVDPKQFVEYHLDRLPKSVHYNAEALREFLGFPAPEFVYFADADSVFDSPDTYWRSRAENYTRITEQTGYRPPPGAYEELILDFWEQAQASQLPQVLLCNDYGDEEAPWFTLRAKLPLKEAERRWRGRVPADMPDEQAKPKIDRWRRAWHDLPADVLHFSDIVETLVRIVLTAYPKL
ncbi:unnamed protein product [Symbiodinium sp. CCMP2592]|nr:unnamed protein product [Symbiodinium sp. CCMP2592]